jgi:hypothetical protein
MDTTRGRTLLPEATGSSGSRDILLMRMMQADRVNVESAYASTMDTWIAWEVDKATEVESLVPWGDG